MTDSEAGTLYAVKVLADIETDNHNDKIENFLQDAREYLKEQKALLNLDPTTNPTKREIALIEKLAAGITIHWIRPGGTLDSEREAKTDIKTHLRSLAQKHTEDGIATGSSQFLKTTGNVRDGNGL